ncbi:hypothetical protein AHAS_Ahas01G0214000 [Arachis hypogaea]
MENPPKRHPTLTRPIRRIKELLNRNWQVPIQHIYREANQLADGIANLLLNQNKEHATWDHLPKETTLILFADRSGVFFSLIYFVFYFVPDLRAFNVQKKYV